MNTILTETSYDTIGDHIIKVLSEDVCFYQESIETKPIILSQTADTTIFKTILQEAEKPNRNKRIYTKKALDEALNRDMILEKIQHKTWYGENGHPEADTVKRQTRIEHNLISHIILRTWWEGNMLWGEIETANTREGKDFQGLIRQGCGVAFSMRGLGGQVFKRNGFEYIDGGLFIMTYDNVNFPSHAPAYIQEIIKEEVDVDIVKNSNKIETTSRNENYDLKNSSILTESDKRLLDDYLKRI